MKLNTLLLAAAACLAVGVFEAPAQTKKPVPLAVDKTTGAIVGAPTAATFRAANDIASQTALDAISSGGAITWPTQVERDAATAAHGLVGFQLDIATYFAGNGTGVGEWTPLYGRNRTLINSLLQSTVDWEGKLLVADTIGRANWGLGKLYEATGLETLDWQNGTVTNPTDLAIAVNWFDRTMWSAAAGISLDWNNRKAYNSDEALMLNWDLGYLFDGTGPTAVSVAFLDRQLRNSTNVSVLDWQTYDLKNTVGDSTLNWQDSQLLLSGTATLNWSNQTLNSAAGGSRANWGTGILSDGTNTAQNWISRTLNDSAGAVAVTWLPNGIELGTTADVGLIRSAANTLSVTDGGAGYSNLKASNLFMALDGTFGTAAGADVTTVWINNNDDPDGLSKLIFSAANIPKFSFELNNTTGDFIGTNESVGPWLNVDGATNTVTLDNLTLTTPLASTNGGTGSGYFNVAGLTAARTFTYPDADGVVPTQLVKIKTTDTSRNTTTTLTDDPTLTQSLTAGTYTVELMGVFLSASSTPGAKFKLTATGGAYTFATGTIESAQNSGSSSSRVCPNSTDADIFGPTVTTASTGARVLANFSILVTSTTTVSFQWAQNTSDGNNTNLKAGSYLKFTRHP